MYELASVNAAAPSTVPGALQNLFAEILSGIDLTVHIDCWGAQVICARQKLGHIPAIVIKIAHPGVIRNFAHRLDVMVLLEAFLEGQLSFDGRMEDLIAMAHQISKAQFRLPTVVAAFCQIWTLPAIKQSSSSQVWKRLPKDSRVRDKKAVAYHYDVGNEFYKLWLDKHLIYSCAQYEDPYCNLESAQEAKLETICRKLRLKPGERLLDIGCGWSGLLIYAAKNYGITGHGITLSAEQLKFGRARIAEEGLQDRVSVEMRHFKDLPADCQYDKISSIEMIEQVRSNNYQEYFGKILSSLNPDGLFLCQMITSNKERCYNDLAEKFMLGYIFPDGELSTLPKTLAAAKTSGWETVDVESWRPQYARTLRDWAQRLESVSEQATMLVGDRRVRLWQLYLIGCALAYEANRLGLYQVLFRKTADRQWNLPWKRSGWLA